MKKIDTYYPGIIVSLCIGIASFLLFVGTIYYIDNTTIPTGNGLYKAPIIESHLLGIRPFSPKHSFYIQHPRYADIVVSVWRVLFLSQWPGTTLTKMAIVNAAFAAIALVALFHITRRITDNIHISTLITVSYALSGYFLFLTISSEDILPAFTLLVLSLFFFYSYTQSEKQHQLVLSGICFAGSILLHRTVIIGLPAFFIGLGSMSKKRSNSLLFFCMNSAVFAIVALGIALLGMPQTTALFSFPGQSGWTGFEWSKLVFTIGAGIGQSIIFRNNFTVVNNIIQPENLFSELLTLLLVGYLLYIVVKDSLHFSKTSAFSAVIASNLILSEGINLYTQGQDPQFQLPALIIIPFGIAILLTKLRRTVFKKQLKGALVIAIIILFIVNGSRAVLAQGHDSKQIHTLQSIQSVFPTKETVFITHGFDMFFTWGTFYWKEKAPLEQFIGLTYFPVTYPVANNEEIVHFALDLLQEKENLGKQLVATDVLLLSDDQIKNQYASINGGSAIIAIRDAIYSRYSLEPQLTTIYGTLYKLIPLSQ